MSTARPDLLSQSASLRDWLRARLPGLDGEIRIDKFPGGQSNPTYAVDGPAGRYVLRSKPAATAELLPSAHAIEREFRLLRALSGTPVPVPEALLLNEDEGLCGRQFYVMSRVDGRIFWDAALPELSAAERGPIYAALRETHAALHALDPEALGLSDFGAPGNYFERQITRWTRQYRASETETIAAMDALIDWLPGQIPESGSSRIVHGDFRIDNLVFHPSEPRVMAVLDWELATLGDPLADFAYQCLPWYTPPGVLRGLAGLDLAGLGLPSLAEHVAGYAALTGANVDLDGIRFHLAYNLFRLAAIAQGVARRARDGTASHARAAETGALARPVAELGWRLARGG